MEPIPEMPHGGSTAPERKGNGHTPQTGNPTIEQVVSRFIAEIDSLADTLPLTMKSIAVVRRSAREEMNKFISKQAVTETDGRVTFRLSADNYHQFTRLNNRGRRTPRSLCVGST